MAGPRYPGFDTLALHAGQSPDPATGSRAVPIYQTTSYVFRDTEHAASLFNMERAGHVYSRISNPTVAVLEERVAALEGGFGIETTFINPRQLDDWQRAMRPNTRLLFGETLGNPGLDVLDIASVAEIAHRAKVPLLVDATFTTPYLLKPFAHGADLLYHSATKFLGGHGTAIGGVLVDSGRFDWDASGKFASLTEAYAGFHNMDFAEESGTRAFLLRARREGLRDFGACMAPMTAFQLLQGVETLHLRMPRHVESTRKVVQFLASHAAVAKVIYPELPDHPDHALAKKLLPLGAGAVFSFEIKGGRAAGKTFIESLRIFSHLANVGDAKSLVIHPASTTHYRMSDADLQKAGITAGSVRLSIGLEDPQDLVDDLDRALRASQK